MSNVMDRNVIDMVLEEKETKKQILIIIDNLEWNCVIREWHARVIQDKVNDYLHFVESGQLEEHYSWSEYEKVVIRIVGQHSFSQYGIEFFERVKAFLLDIGYEFEWEHIPVDENHEKITFHDGFSDDYVFDEEKVYPRLKLNLAEKPVDSIKIMLNDNHFKDNENERMWDNLLMVSFFEQRYIGIFIQNVGSTYKILTYDDLPKEYEVARLQQKAFENICRDIEYQVVESAVESGIYGLIAGGNFEAEGICLEIWENISEKLNDNILIAMPTKDLVIFVPAGNKKLVKKMINMARNTLYHNLQTDPKMVFTHDVFLYDRDKKKIEISEKYKV